MGWVWWNQMWSFCNWVASVCKCCYPYRINEKVIPMIKDFGYFKKSLKGKGNNFYSNTKIWVHRKFVWGFFLPYYFFKHYVKKKRRMKPKALMWFLTGYILLLMQSFSRVDHHLCAKVHCGLWLLFPGAKMQKHEIIDVLSGLSCIPRER